MMTRKLVRYFSCVFLFLLFCSLRTNGSIDVDVADDLWYVRHLAWWDPGTHHSDNTCTAIYHTPSVPSHTYTSALKHLCSPRLLSITHPPYHHTHTTNTFQKQHLLPRCLLPQYPSPPQLPPP
ncbi:hypothetical protein BDR22DRAFT_838528 [Usnea florida]